MFKPSSQFNIGDLVRVSKHPTIYHELKNDYARWAKIVDEALTTGEILEISDIQPLRWKECTWLSFRGKTFAFPEDALEAVFTI